MTVEVLYTSEAIRKSIRTLFGKNSGRRVAIVAFVGKGAEAYLPSPKGLELYCWPSPSGTNPAAVKRLIDRFGVSVAFAPRIHMKLYWSSRRGAIVTSSNLSSNAYGHGDLKEFGVRLPGTVVDIDRVIRGLGAKPVTKAALEALTKAYAEERANRKPRSSKASVPSFADWSHAERREPWKFSVWEGAIGASRRLKDAAAQHGVARGRIENWITCGRGELAEDDYVLSVKLAGRGRVVSPEWIFVNKVVLVERSDPQYDEHNPFQAAQMHPLRFYRRPPFKIDGAFRAALRTVAREMTPVMFEKYINAGGVRSPSRKLLERLREAYAKAAG